MIRKHKLQGLIGMYVVPFETDHQMVSRYFGEAVLVQKTTQPNTVRLGDLWLSEQSIIKCEILTKKKHPEYYL